jgi:cytochrome c peroxidase
MILSVHALLKMGVGAAYAETPASISYQRGVIPEKVKSRESYQNPSGLVGLYLPEGTISTGSNAFFQTLGTNGRSCVTCHQPPSGMSLSLRNVRSRLAATRGTDPLFATVDGANCPDALQKVIAAQPSATPLERVRAASSLLLSRGTVRIALPWPPRDATGLLIAPDFDLTITPDLDPAGCNTNPVHGIAAAGAVSVYRRPPSVAQINLKTHRFGSTTAVIPGSLMWDGRSPSLEQQTIEAARVHLQSVQDPTPEQIAQIIDFQGGVFVAQAYDAGAGWLDIDGAHGGPINLRNRLPQVGVGVTFSEYSRWFWRGGKSSSIARGQNIFNALPFNVANVDGFNSAPNAPVLATCSSCHNTIGSGADGLPLRQTSIGVGGSSVFFGGRPAAEDLPRFTLACHSGAVTGFQGTGPIMTNDPGLALITGRCSDIGRFTVPQLRALASREPYFHDGSAKTLDEVIKFYMGRFGIPLAEQQQEDLVNFLLAL